MYFYDKNCSKHAKGEYTIHNKIYRLETLETLTSLFMVINISAGHIIFLIFKTHE